MAPGLMSAGLGDVPAAQTYLDISQGNRVFNSLYDEGLPRRVGGGICGPAYSRAVVERAESAPADIVPGLLATTLRAAGETCTVRGVSLRRLLTLVAGLAEDDLIIAIERAPPEKNEALAIGVAGRGFEGNLTTDSTRTDGYVLSTDVAPTILEQLGIAVPDEMSGQAIRAEGNVDVAAIESLGSRLAVISERRGPVIGVSLLAWILAAGLTIVVVGRSRAWLAIELLALSIVYLPLVLLLGAALEPGLGAERLLVMVGAPCLAAATLAVLPGYRALAVASGSVVLAYALDVLAGSPLTALSLWGRTRVWGCASTGSATSSRRCWRCWSSPGLAQRLRASPHGSRRAAPRWHSSSAGCSAPGSSPLAVLAPTSARRSSCQSARPSPPRRSRRAGGGQRCWSSARRSPCSG